MSIRAEAHFKISSAGLAEWLEQQGMDRWWSVDGDPLLTGRLSFPCPADELATELRRLNRPLLVQDRGKNPSGRGQTITAQELDALATQPGNNLTTNGARPGGANDRILFLAWESGGDDWMLVEDMETTESSRRDAVAQENK